MSCTRQPALVSLALFASLTPAAAWSPATRIEMVRDAVRFMPASLRLVLAGYEEPLLRGMLEPLTSEDAPRHKPPWVQGTLDARIAEETRGLLDALAGRPAFSDVARRFGELAHYVADARFPPGIGRQSQPWRYRHFAEFCEDRQPRFPLVFYGHDDPALARGDYRGFALRILEQAAADDVELTRAYAAAGETLPESAFDDRSVPFAVGSLSYSQGVTEIVRIWLDTWYRAGGDMGRTPYWEPPVNQGSP